ncbi:AAA family ATPase [Galenea microaerophila]
MIIHVGNQKGGCGKSTLAVNIAAELSRRGKDVILVDADRQETSSFWALERQERDLPKVSHVQLYENIYESVKDLAKRYEYLIIDSAGRDSRELRTGMVASDILLTPFRPSQPDLDVLQKFSKVVQEAKDFNPSLKVYSLFNLAPTNPQIKEVEEAEEYMSLFPDFQLLNTVIRDRKVYRDAMSYGMSVVEMDNEKAKQEIKSLIGEILDGSS